MKYDKIGLAHAVNGITGALKTEKNLRRHLIAGTAAVVLGLLLSLKPVEWLILLLTIHIVLIAELINTAIERAVDISCQDILKEELDRNPIRDNARAAKDAAAGAVLLAACMSILVGIIIFVPKLADLVRLPLP